MLLFKFTYTKNARTIFRIISQNHPNVKTHCNDLYDSFHFACRRLMLNQ